MQTSQTPLLVKSSCYAYNLLLFFYPYSLRSRFQQQMASLFEDQAFLSWEQSGYRGVLKCWWRAIAELLCVALPARLDSLKIPVLSILISIFLTVLFFAKVIPQCSK
jgi:hypothetical protein